MSDTITVVEGLNLVVSLATGHVQAGDLAVARTTADAVRSRTGYVGTTMVLALVGGTGSGKSSLLNAIAGDSIASISPLRPHTTAPMAWIPSQSEPSLHFLLDRLGVEQRVTHDRFTNLAILDMTDLDSVAFENRDLVEMLMPEVDVIVWVLDPVKYADSALHSEFVGPLAGASDRMLFVLNKVDQLDKRSLDDVLEHLEQLLVDGGVADPAIFPVASDPPGGCPRGIEALTAYLENRLDEKRVHVGKIIDDAGRVARSVADAASVDSGGSLDFEERWLGVREAIVADVVAGGGAAALEEALRIVEGFILKLSTDASGVFGLRIRQSFGVELIERELSAAVVSTNGSSHRRRDLDDQLQKRFGAPLRRMLWERASLSAVVAGLAVDTMTVGKIIGRNPA